MEVLICLGTRDSSHIPPSQNWKGIYAHSLIIYDKTLSNDKTVGAMTEMKWGGGIHGMVVSMETRCRTFGCCCCCCWGGGVLLTVDHCGLSRGLEVSLKLEITSFNESGHSVLADPISPALHTRGLIADDASNHSPLFKGRRCLDAGNIHVVHCHGA